MVTELLTREDLFFRGLRAHTTEHQLDQFREYKRETYDELIRKMIYIVENVKTKPELSREAVAAIEAARKRIKAGKIVSEEEAKKRLGF